MNKFITIGFALLLAFFLTGCNKHNEYTYKVNGLAEGRKCIICIRGKTVICIKRRMCHCFKR